MKDLVNPEIIEGVAETANVSLIRRVTSKPAVKYTGLFLTGAVVVYGAYRFGKFMKGKISARHAAKEAKLAEGEPAPVEEAPADNPAA